MLAPSTTADASLALLIAQRDNARLIILAALSAVVSLAIASFAL